MKKGEKRNKKAMVTKKKVIKKRVPVKKKVVKKKVVKKKPAKKKLTKPQVTAMENKKLYLLFLEKNKYVSKACELSKLSRKTFYEYYGTDSEFKDSVDHIRKMNDEALLDSCEDKLGELIEGLNRKSIEFYLLNKGRDRGYSKDAILEIKRDRETPLTDEELALAARGLDESN